MKAFYTAILSLLFALIMPFSQGYSLAQKDTIPNIIKVWSIDFTDLSVDSLSIDTGLSDLQSGLPIFSDNYMPLWCGNYGLPYSEIVSFRNVNLQNPFIENLKGYMIHSGNQEYYNTRKPVSRVNYINSGSKAAKSQVLSLLHTQNVNKDLNVGFRVLFNHSLGDYMSQEVKNTSIGFWTSLQKERYELYASLNYNKFKTQENGGFLNDSTFESGSYDDAKFIDVNLLGAKSTNYFYEANFIHSLNLLAKDTTGNSRLIKDFKLVHNLKLSKSARSYYDEDPSFGFYQDIYIDSVLTNDSVGVNELYNYVYLEGRSKNEFINARAGLFHSIEKYYFSIEDIYLSNIGVKGGLDFNIGNLFKGLFNTEISLIGDYSGESKSELLLNYKLFNSPKAPIFGFRSVVKNEGAFLYLSSYSANNFEWDNSFNQMTSTETDASVNWPYLFSKARVSIGNVNNLIYFDENALPNQYSGTISYFAAEFNSSIPIKNFRIGANVLYQNNDKKNIMPVPELNVKSSISYNTFMFKKALHIGFGLDLQYFSSYYAPAYMPALGVFYNQSDKEIGNYPYLDVSLIAKVRNFRLLLKYHHLNESFTSQSFYSAYNMAAPPQRFTFGISWMFYD